MIDYHIDVGRHLITTRAAGHVSYAELAAYLHRLYRDPHFASNLDGLIVAMDPGVVPTPSPLRRLDVTSHLSITIPVRIGAPST